MKYISLLRGINVSGQKKILMADLRDLYVDLGFSEVVSYIQSGNVIFDSRKSAKSCISIIQVGIKTAYGFDVPVQILTVDQWRKTIDSNPFLMVEPEIANEQLYVTFLAEKPKKEDVESLKDFYFGEDAWTLAGAIIYCKYATRYSNSKLNNNFIEKKLKASATSRNWKTTLKLLELSTASIKK